MQPALEVCDYCGGKYFTKPCGRHTGILHRELDHPRKLISKLTAGKLYVSDCRRLNNTREGGGQNERAALTVLVISKQSGCASAFHDGNGIRITIRLPAAWESTST